MGIDLSVGSMVALVGVLTIMILNGLGDGWFAVSLAIVAAITMGGMLGVVQRPDYFEREGRIIYCDSGHYVDIPLAHLIYQ